VTTKPGRGGLNSNQLRDQKDNANANQTEGKKFLSKKERMQKKEEERRAR